MVLMPFTKLSTDEKESLRSIARDSITYGLQHGAAMPIALEQYSSLLRQQGACFVTLNLNHQLRGCIGTLEAYQPLAKDVADHAYAAAFQDPRFPPVSEKDAEQLEIHISILTAPKAMTFSSQKDLLSQLQPGIDGLVLSDGYHKGTFLPSVWEQLPEPVDFLNHLKLKAGLDAHYWSDTIEVSRYQAISV